MRKHVVLLFFTIQLLGCTMLDPVQGYDMNTDQAFVASVTLSMDATSVTLPTAVPGTTKAIMTLQDDNHNIEMDDCTIEWEEGDVIYIQFRLLKDTSQEDIVTKSSAKLILQDGRWILYQRTDREDNEDYNPQSGHYPDGKYQAVEAINFQIKDPSNILYISGTYDKFNWNGTRQESIVIDAEGRAIAGFWVGWSGRFPVKEGLQTISIDKFYHMVYLD